MDIDLEKTDPELFTVRPDILNPPALVRQLDFSDLSFSFSFRESDLSLEQQLNDLPGAACLQSENMTRIDTSEPSPLAQGLSAKHYDGCFIGRDGKLYSSDLNPLYVPVHGSINCRPKPDEFPTIYINGILTSTWRAYSQIDELSRKTSLPVLGIYNASESEFEDVLQSILDKFDLGFNKSARCMQNLIEDALRQNKRLHIVAESQGAIITSRAISNAIHNLRECGWSEKKITERLSRLEVETIGGAAWVYPDGPKYVHYINNFDPIPSYFGLGKYGISETQLKGFRDQIHVPQWLDLSNSVLTLFELDRLQGLHPGRDARIIRFEQKASSHWLESHQMQVYLKHHLPFEEAYKLEAARASGMEDRPAFFRPLAALSSLILSALAFRKLRKNRVLKKTKNSTAHATASSRVLPGPGAAVAQEA